MDLEKILPTNGPSIDEVKKYIEKYLEEIIVIKCGGSVLLDENLFRQFIEDVSVIYKLGLSVIVVHGGGPRIKKKLEEKNIDFDVVTDEDLHKDSYECIKNYSVIITGTHPEYYSLKMIEAMQQYTNNGGRLMYLGGNGFYWRISYDKNSTDIIECRKSEAGIRAVETHPGESYSSLTGEYTGLWRRNDYPPNKLVGVGMASQGFDVSSPYFRKKQSYNKNSASNYFLSIGVILALATGIQLFFLASLIPIIFLFSLIILLSIKKYRASGE